MSDAPPRILIVRLSALGDVIHVLPALSALRRHWPDAHLGWAVETAAASLLLGHPQLDRVHVIARKEWATRLKRGAGLSVGTEARQAVAEIRAEGYTHAIDFQSNFRSSLVARLSGAKVRVGQPKPFAKEFSPLFSTLRPDPIDPQAHKILRNMELLRPLGVALDPVPRGELPPRDPTVAAELRGQPGPHVLVQPGVSRFGALKAYPAAHYVQVARGLVASGARVWISYGPGELPLAEHVVAGAPGARLAPETRSVLDFVALLEAADLFVGVDSGPLHLAACVGTPVLGLYGPKSPSIYGPFFEPSRVVRSGYPCSPCTYRRCPLPEVRPEETPTGTWRISPCMDTLDPQDVLAAALELLPPHDPSSTIRGAEGVP
ncbi:MAG: glycosyltransferase family 9 protein [Planctomycetota bacterium]